MWISLLGYLFASGILSFIAIGIFFNLAKDSENEKFYSIIFAIIFAIAFTLTRFAR